MFGIVKLKMILNQQIISITVNCIKFRNALKSTKSHVYDEIENSRFLHNCVKKQAYLCVQ